MKNLKNTTQLIGNIGGDVEFKTTESGKSLATASIAVNTTYLKGDGEKVSVVDWFNIKFWGKTAVNAEKLLKKGSHVVINATLKPRSWEKDNVKHYTIDIIVDSFLLVDSKSPEAAAVSVTPDEATDDLPF